MSDKCYIFRSTVAPLQALRVRGHWVAALIYNADFISVDGLAGFGVAGQTIKG